MYFNIRPELIFHNRYVLWVAVAALLAGGVMLWASVSSAANTHYLLQKGIAVQAKVAERQKLKSKGQVIRFQFRLTYKVPGYPHHYEHYKTVGKKEFDATPLRSPIALKVHPKDHSKAVLDGKNPHIPSAVTSALLTFGSIYYLWAWHKYTDIVGLGARPYLDPHVKSYGGF